MWQLYRIPTFKNNAGESFWKCQIYEKGGGSVSKNGWKNSNIKPPTIKNNVWKYFLNDKFTKKEGGVSKKVRGNSNI